MRRPKRPSRDKRLQNRRGVTLILMTVMFVVLIGVAAFAVDFGRMYLFRAELHTASDAAALAAAFRIMKNDPTTAQDSAVSYAGRHVVENLACTGPVPPCLVPADVIPGTWDPTLPDSSWREDPDRDWTKVTNNAAQVTTHYTASYGFGQIFGLASHRVNVTSRAAVGSVGATTCIRPVAIPYRKLLDQLFPPATPSDTVPVSYNLTANDVIALRTATIANEVQLKLGDDATSGNFYLLQMGPYAHSNQIPLSPSPSWNGNNVFVDRFAGDCANSPWAIGPGDWVMGKQGNADGPAASGVEELCDITISGPSATPYNCTAPIADRTIKVAMWATEDDGVCSPRCFQVKYTGVFVVTKYLKTSGGAGQDGLYGYFSAMPSTGSFTAIPSPLSKIALVK